MKRAALCCALAMAACGGPPAASVTRASAENQAGPPPPPPADGIEVLGALLPPMPVAVTSFGADRLGEHLYTLGGYHGEPHVYHREGQSRALLRVRLDGEGAWEQVGFLDEGLQGLALVAHDGVLCRVGGNRILNAEGEEADMRSVDEAACFDPADGSWRALPALPSGRSSHEAEVVGDTLYVAGGWRLDESGPSEATWAEDILALDLHGGTGWRTIPAPFRRRAVGVASAAGKLVVVGGLTPEREVVGRVDVFDPSSGEWSRGPDFPSDAFGAAAVGLGDAVYVSARSGIVHRWRVGEEAWTEVTSLAFPRFFHQLVAASDDTLIAVGGIGGMHTEGRTRHVERVALSGDAPAVLGWSMPYEGAAKNRQAAFVHGDYVYLFGGNNSLEQHDFEPENFVSEGLRLHLPSATWERVADYPARRQTMQTLTAGDHGIAVGGFGHDGTAAVTHPEAFDFDFESGAWSPRGGLARGRTQFGLTTHDDRYYVFGGLNYDPAREGAEAFEHVTVTLATPEGDPSGAFEATDVELPGPRRAFAGATMGDRYYVVGGMRGGFELVDDCLVYDFASHAFSPIACPRRTRLSATLMPLDGALYLVGGSYRGEEGMETDRSVEVYDPEADAWRVVIEELPFDTRHMHVLSYRDRLLLVSTHTEEPRARVVLVEP